MARSASNPPADTADAVSNAVITPEVSLFVREILEKALTNPEGVAPRWAADAWALLANVLLNDYLNWWNYAGLEELRKADDAAHNALALSPALPFAHHALGLVYRASRQHNAARKAFREAKRQDPGFARGHAQFGNQKSLLGRLDEVQDPLDKAMSLSPRHPASGYFYWGKGRGFFEQQRWGDAILWLQRSVDALPTVWYNRCYLATAQDAAKDSSGADKTMTDFLNDPRIDRSTYPRIVPSLQTNSNDPRTVAAARKRVLAFVHPKYL